MRILFAVVAALLTAGTLYAGQSPAIFNRVIADTQPGSDACAKIHSALLARPSTGGVVDATAFEGNQACTSGDSNWYSGIASSGQLLLGAATFELQAQLVVPNKNQMIGVGRGDGGNNTTIEAVSGFPTSTVVVEYGSSGPIFGVSLANLTIDCNNISGVGGLENLYAEEQSGADHLLIYECPGTALHIDTGAGGDSSPWQNLELVNDSGCTNCGSSSTLLSLTGSTSLFVRTIQDVTANTNGPSTQPNEAIQIDTSNVLLSGIHCQTGNSCIKIGDLNDVSGVSIANLNVSYGGDGITIPNLNAVTNVVLAAIQAQSGSNILHDSQDGITLTSAAEGGVLGFWALGNGSSPRPYLSSSINLGSTMPILTIANHLNQTAVGKFAGKCTMPASTSCTISISNSYSNSPGCVATVQSATPLYAGCTVSGTTITITANTSNSSTWGAMLFGNPN